MGEVNNSSSIFFVSTKKRNLRSTFQSATFNNKARAFRKFLSVVFKIAVINKFLTLKKKDFPFIIEINLQNNTDILVFF